MKIVEIKPRRKHISGIVFDIEIVPEDYGADVDPVGLLALDSELCEMKRLKSGTELSDEALTELVRESHIKRAKCSGKSCVKIFPITPHSVPSTERRSLAL